MEIIIKNVDKVDIAVNDPNFSCRRTDLGNKNVVRATGHKFGTVSKLWCGSGKTEHPMKIICIATTESLSPPPIIISSPEIEVIEDDGNELDSHRQKNTVFMEMVEKMN